MNELIICDKKPNSFRIMSPFGEWTIDTTKFDLECFKESCEYWGIKIQDLDREMVNFNQKINQKLAEIRLINYINEIE